MQESLTLFNEMVNNKNFEDMPFIVFFNKRDLFEEKIKKKSIAVAFPNYQVSSEIYNRGWTVDTGHFFHISPAQGLVF